MQIEAKILAKSISPEGKILTTWELTYPRMIHAELMTHGMLIKNAASSRAIPIAKVIEMVRNNPAMPVHWGKNQPGMQAQEELTGDELSIARGLWLMAADYAAQKAEDAVELVNGHKQWVNRLLEPFQWMKTVVTGTEWANFYWLRNHEAADPTFRALAALMSEVNERTPAKLLQPGEWHLPYFFTGFWNGGNTDYTLEDAIAISMSCCAQVSYRTLDDSLEKAYKVVERLNLGTDMTQPVHASPSGHQGTPMKKGRIGNWEDSVNLPPFLETWEDGITAYHKELGFMSGNLAGWIQNRQLIKGHTKW